MFKQLKKAAIMVTLFSLCAVVFGVGSPVQAAGYYSVQPGDTLADISTIFYGAPEHWRLLITANPGLDPAQMTVGSVLTIPPKP